MILDQESWTISRCFQQLRAGGMSCAEIGGECGCDWRTVRMLAEDAPPSAPSRKGTQRGSYSILKRVITLIGSENKAPRPVVPAAAT